MPRQAGIRNRNYPSLTLEQALVIAEAISEKASGMTVSKLTLAGFLGSTPGSSSFREQLLASRAYGLTTGGVNGNEFGLDQLGEDVTSDDPERRLSGLRSAVMNVAPYAIFLRHFDGKKVPVPSAMGEFLVNNAKVPDEWKEDCIEHLLADARFVGFLGELKGSEYVAFKQPERPQNAEVTENGQDHEDSLHTEHSVLETAPTQRQVNNNKPQEDVQQPKPKSIFVAHGKNRKPLEQLKQLLVELGVPFKVAVDEPHAGRPVGEKVASMMRNECSSAICIFSADEPFLRKNEDGEVEEIWRPSENVVYELGAASVLYGRRIILFKEDKVTLPSDFRDIGYISFVSDSIQSHMLELLKELKAHGVVEVVVPM